jgi:hypothetical protein
VFAFHSFSFLDTCTQNSVAAAPAQRIAAGTRRALLLTAVVGYCWWVVEVDACLNSRRGLAAMRTRRPITTLISMLLRRLVVLAMVPALSPVGAAHARPLTTAPGLTITIHVTITDTRIALKPDKAPRGVEARFVIKNLGAKPHNFTLNGKTVTPGVLQRFSRTLNPHQQEIVRIFLDRRARLPYLGGLAADRGKPGMHGFFVIN